MRSFRHPVSTAFRFFSAQRERIMPSRIFGHSLVSHLYVSSLRSSLLGLNLQSLGLQSFSGSRFAFAQSVFSYENENDSEANDPDSNCAAEFEQEDDDLMGNKLPKEVANNTATKKMAGTALEKQVEGLSSITHYVNKKKIWDNGPVPQPEGSEQIILGMGCFWCSENLWMHLKEDQGIYSTSVGYFAGHTTDPTYGQICSGRTGHVEACRLIYNPSILPLRNILVKFWEYHNPTQLNGQGNDRGTQYRSGIWYFTDEQKKIAEESKQAFQKVLGGKEIKTEITSAVGHTYFMAEESHQQYDAKPGMKNILSPNQCSIMKVLSLRFFTFVKLSFHICLQVQGSIVDWRHLECRIHGGLKTHLRPALALCKPILSF